MMTDYSPRDIAPLIGRALGSMPVVVVTGMRQTGKSTMLRMDRSLSEREYVSFDDFAQLAAAREDPDGFVRSRDRVTIDEAQKCPDILTAIKKAVDEDRTPGRFILSGSANFSMLKGVSETLAGRAVYFTLHPFTRREITGKQGGRPFLRVFFDAPDVLDVKAAPVDWREVLSGGMPSVCLHQVEDAGFWFKGFEQTYLERDIMEFSRIGNVIPFRNLLHLAALRTGQLLSPSQLGRDAQLKAATAARYLSILDASFVIRRVSPYLKNRSSRLIKSPKMYMSDSGLACYLAGIREPGIEGEHPLKGALLETYVAQNLSGLIDSCWPDAELGFWHIQGRHEVDFVIEDGGKCLALEIKSGARWSEGDLSGLKAFLAKTPHCKAGILAYNGDTPVQLGERLWAIPLGTVLS
ncbi:MAG: ATP-binding protein [bacterium]|nr:ATP-binding protein [bacterium]